MPDDRIEPETGEITSADSYFSVGSHLRKPHCETCGSECSPLFDDGHFVAYRCPQHGPLTHDAIVWVYHDMVSHP